jgi:2',3'-cyclic-nucleotide 2'-phosphodiesterase (5'-nucleotidase family)
MQRFLLLIGYWLLVQGCSTYQPQSLFYDNYRVSDSSGRSQKLEAMLAPYREEVDLRMNEVIGHASMDLDKKMPESTMGNFFADALLAMAREKYNRPVDAAVINHGGLRLNQLAAGPVTRGKIFELMPFDNLLILQELKGDVLQQFLDNTAARGGWPLAGITMKIRDKKAVEVKVNGSPLDPSATYVLANSDYLANGGDNSDMLRPVPQIQNGYLMRDAFIDYIIKLQREGRQISAQLENRVSNAE